MAIREILIKYEYHGQVWYQAEPLYNIKTMGLTHEIPKNSEGRLDGVLVVNEEYANKVRKDIHVVVSRPTEG